MQFSPFSLSLRAFFTFIHSFVHSLKPVGMDVYLVHRKHDVERTAIKIGLVKNMYMAIFWTSISMQYLKSNTHWEKWKRNKKDRWLSHTNNDNSSSSSIGIGNGTKCALRNSSHWDKVIGTFWLFRVYSV